MKPSSRSDASTSSSSLSSFTYTLSNLFISKDAYQHVGNEFHPFHQHDMNVALHLLTSGLGFWGALQLVLITFDQKPGGLIGIYAYAVLVALTTPIIPTAILHTGFVYLCLQLEPSVLLSLVVRNGDDGDDDNGGIMSLVLEPWKICVGAIVIGFALQELAHYLCVENTYMGYYMNTAKKDQFKPYMLIVHTVWLMPLVIDAVMARHFFLPFVPSRNRVIECSSVASTASIDQLRLWIKTNVPVDVPETTHIWPHQQQDTSVPVTALENDTNIYDAFRKIVFATKHYDILPVQGMNEIYVTAVGSKKEINSDAVFYTSHVDGPYWWLPGCSLYRVLVGITPNEMVRTRFNLQHESQNRVVTTYGVLGFDYNRELHWIDHVPGIATNAERRSVLKLHYIVYPKGWHRYGKIGAALNSSYNTWARKNFLRTLRPSGMYEIVLAWWIWVTTYTHATLEYYIGWSNIVYVLLSYCISGGGPDNIGFLILTSFRHYMVYITTFAYRTPMIGHGYLMRDAMLYKTISMMNLAYRLLPMMTLPRDLPCIGVASLGFLTTFIATARLGMVRTYFGTELGFVEPCWIEGFPYDGLIPHPMINGQIFALTAILVWYRKIISEENGMLVVAHITCYVIHMMQEIHTSGAYYNEDEKAAAAAASRSKMDKMVFSALTPKDPNNDDKKEK